MEDYPSFLPAEGSTGPRGTLHGWGTRTVFGCRIVRRWHPAGWSDGE